MSETATPPPEIKDDEEEVPPQAEENSETSDEGTGKMQHRVTVTKEPELDDDSPPAEAPGATENSEPSDEGTGKMQRRVTVTAATAPFDMSYHPSVVKFFSPPTQRQRWGDKQVLPRVNWNDLFVDLFFVGAMYNTSNILVEFPGKTGLLYFFGTFGPIMQLWTLKMFYDARFVVGDDLFHRVGEVASIVVLASAILHIRPVDVLSNPSENVDMFGFCLSMSISILLVMLRWVELYFFGVGQPVIKETAKFDFKMCCVPFSFLLAATIVAGLEHFGSDGSHRLLAEANSAPKVETTNVPIWLCLASTVSFWIVLTIRVIFILPDDGSHKKFSKYITAFYVDLIHYSSLFALPRGDDHRKICVISWLLCFPANLLSCML
jgi:hypothetical protein